MTVSDSPRQTLGTWNLGHGF